MPSQVPIFLCLVWVCNGFCHLVSQHSPGSQKIRQKLGTNGRSRSFHNNEMSIWRDTWSKYEQSYHGSLHPYPFLTYNRNPHVPRQTIVPNNSCFWSFVRRRYESTPGTKKPLPLPHPAYMTISIVLHKTSSYWNSRTLMCNISSGRGEQNFPLFFPAYSRITKENLHFSSYVRWQENHWRVFILEGDIATCPRCVFYYWLLYHVSGFPFSYIEGYQNFGKSAIVSICSFYSNYYNDTNRHNRTPIIL